MKIKNTAYFLLGIMLSIGTIRAHVEPKKMLFYTRKKLELTGALAQQKVQIAPTVYEQRSNGGPSKVLNVCGLAAFKQAVLLSSFTKPVVVKVHAVASVESGKVKPHFQDVADLFDQKVACVSINLLEQGMENRAIVAHLLAKCGVHRVDLPLFLFFRNGQLQLPVRQGFHTKDNLASLIQKEFFSESKNNQNELQKTSQSVFHDWVPTHATE